MSKLTPKFDIGSRVEMIGDPDADAGEVVGLSYNADSGFRYQITSKEVDMAKKEISHGIKNCLENELKEVKSE